jgi:hypothetical protein
MPRTTKDVEKKTVNKTKTNSDKAIKDAEKVTKKTTTKKASSKSTTVKKETKKVSAKTTKKADTTKKPVSAKSTSRKTTQKSSSSRTKITATAISQKELTEYYDLPYRYNQTVVKILAQTPRTLFVYWDISDEDHLEYQNKYGDDFFTKTKPVLIIHNETKNYTFEIEINDFANSWYLQVSDANCKYLIELGRRAIEKKQSTDNTYFYITSSNEMDAPNDHILFEKFNTNVKYKNIKTGQETIKDFSHLSQFKNMQEIYGIYDLYKQIYKNELFDEIIEGNTSLSSSTFKK